MMQASVSYEYFTKADLHLATDAARKLFDIPFERGRIGLVQFGKVCQRLFNAYKEDDPYAHWALLKLYQQLSLQLEEFKKVQLQLRGLFNANRGIKPRLDVPMTDWIKPLSFNVFCAYQAAECLAQADQLFWLLDLIRRFAMIQSVTDWDAKRVREQLFSVFSIGLKWKYTGVKRSDILAQNEVAKRAENKLREWIERYGSLPSEILHQDIQFDFLPPIITKAS